MGHAVGMTAYAACAGVAASNDFAEYRQIRVHAEKSLCAAQTNTETRDHLIKDEQRTVLPRQTRRPPDELPADGPGAALRAHGL